MTEASSTVLANESLAHPSQDTLGKAVDGHWTRVLFGGERSFAPLGGLWLWLVMFSPY